MSRTFKTVSDGQRPFYYMVTALFLGLVSKSLLTEGMFTDGVTYAVISRNLAGGLGSLWDLHYTATLYPHFHEHPPLAFWIQSIFFRIFGDHIYVERVYSAGTFFLAAIAVVLIWKQIAPAGSGTMGWLPLLFWLLEPLVSWAASNNLLENTVMIFTGFAVLLILKSRQKPGWNAGGDTAEPGSCPRYRQLYLLLAAVLLGCGFLTKGFVALFPLSLPFWLFLFHRRDSFRRFLSDTLILISGIFGFLLLIILLMPESRESLEAYLTGQVIGSITGVRTVGNRFHIAGRIVLAVLPGIMLLLMIWLAGGRGRIARPVKSWFFIFLALGLSGVLPIMISLKQRDFYILPALPFLSVALALPAASIAGNLVKKLLVRAKFFRVLRVLSTILLMAAIGVVVARAGRIDRDRELLADVQTLVKEIPNGSIICIPRELFGEWDLHAYMHRYGMISLDPGYSCASSYFLVDREYPGITDPSCGETDLDLNTFRLFTCSAGKALSR